MKRSKHDMALAILNAHWEEDIINTSEKLKRALSPDWEFIGDLNSLCQILREEILRLRVNRQSLVKALLERGDRAKERMNDETMNLHRRFESAIEFEAWERAASLVNCVLRQNED